MSIKYLEMGETIPTGIPKRYTTGPYVMLRWKVGIRQYVEVREHQVKNGKVIEGVVHHRNLDKHDNHSDNLRKDHADHLRHHRKIDYQAIAQLYASGSSTKEIESITGHNCGNISRIIKDQGVSSRYGKGKPAWNKMIRNENLEQKVSEALSANNYNIATTSRRLGLDRNTVRIIMKVLGIKPNPKGCRDASRRKDPAGQWMVKQS